MADSVLTDPLGRVCTLSDRTWERHILVVHPDREGGRDSVEEAISNPKSVRTSRSDNDVRVYFADGPKRGLLIAVKVDIARKIVLTAHLARRESGGVKEWTQPVP